ncbi:hypothetical protein [Azotobacter salinestris]|uniref:hypothetical protein n=1 Tax=Azotobacter salinestris TaxID=69964 RepID=UPI001266E587|nr:hypothetical protein [Azotobacter salinestris]
MNFDIILSSCKVRQMNQSGKEQGMVMLAPGANTRVPGVRSTWTPKCRNSSAFGDYTAAALLPVGAKRHPQNDPASFQTSHEWMEWRGRQRKGDCNLKLAWPPAGSDRTGKSTLIGEFYNQNHPWNFCALAEGAQLSMAP